MTAYFRLKADSNASTDEIARVSVKGGGQEYGPLRLRGIDFNVADQYQEFPVTFVFHDNPDDVFLAFQIWRSGSTEVCFDAVTVFTPPRQIADPLIWGLPGGNYRGQSIWLRYTNADGNAFSGITEPPGGVSSPEVTSWTYLPLVRR